jgi:cobaltochelatase CobS
MFKDKMKSIEMCISRFDEETRNSILDLYTKVDDGVHLEDESSETFTEEVNFESDENDY